MSHNERSEPLNFEEIDQVWNHKKLTNFSVHEIFWKIKKQSLENEFYYSYGYFIFIIISG